MSFFDIFVDTHLGIIDLTTDKRPLHTVVQCFSGGSWWGEVVSYIPRYATFVVFGKASFGGGNEVVVGGKRYCILPCPLWS
jgi:hypothetical protein